MVKGVHTYRQSQSEPIWNWRRWQIICKWIATIWVKVKYWYGYLPHFALSWLEWTVPILRPFYSCILPVRTWWQRIKNNKYRTCPTEIYPGKVPCLWGRKSSDPTKQFWLHNPNLYSVLSVHGQTGDFFREALFQEYAEFCIISHNKPFIERLHWLTIWHRSNCKIC